MKSQSSPWSVLKRFLVIFLPLLALVSIITVQFYYIEAENAKRERFIFETDEANRISQQIKIITDSFNSIKLDLIILAGHNDMHHLLETGDEYFKESLSEEFSVFCKTKGIYDQVRFLDDKGMEVVRVNYNAGNPYIVPESQLQFKGGRYYFNDIFKLDKEDMYVSLFDLNIEDDNLEMPLKPMIRFGTSIFDSNGQKRGILVLNYLGKNIINRLKSVTDNAPGRIMLLNSNGYWMYGAKPEYEWGFMYKDRKGLTFGNTFPEAWSQISSGSSGHFYNANGLFTYATVYPHLRSEKSTTTIDITSKELQEDEYAWKIVSCVSPDVLRIRLGNFIMILMSIYGSVIILIGAVSWFMASSGVRRRIAEEHITSFAHILEESLNEIYIFDAKTLRFIQVNEGARQNLGYSMEELSNLTPVDLKPEFTVESFEKMVEPLWSGEKQRLRLTTLHRRKDGSVYDVEVYLQLSEFQSIPVFVAIILDITERIKTEKVLIQSEKLKSLGMITSGIAHDFNNILSVISGNAQILKMGNEDNKKLIDGLRIIHKASDDGAEIVRRMRIFTKQEKDTSALLPVDIKGVLKQAIDFVKPRWMNIAKAGGINYEIDKNGIVEVPIIMGIESELREVFINIMNNAMDSMPEGGSLSFCTWQSEVNVFISISDTGEGMSVDVKNKVFEPFYTTKREKGSGLGMSMSYGIIERHGGGIEVKSEVGKGTTFTIRLPIAEPPAQKNELPVEDQNKKVKGLSILVVDDKKDMRTLLEEFFAKNGHIVKTADSGNRAIEVLKAETFDLVLSDLVMPDVSGHKVVDVLNSLEKRPKIGVMTGWSEKVETKDENELNVDFIIKKPFNFSVLAGHVNDLFGADSR